MVALGVLRRPHRRHRGQRVDRGGVGALEEDALGGQAVDLRRRRPRVAVGVQLARAGRVEDDEEDVHPRGRLPQRTRARSLLGGRRRTIERCRRARDPVVTPHSTQDARRRPEAPGVPLAGGRPADVQTDAHDVSRPPRQRDAQLPRRRIPRPENPAPRFPLLARPRLDGHAEGGGRARGAGGRMQVGREAQLRARRQPNRIADDSGADLDEGGGAPCLHHREGMRRIARQQVFQALVARRGHDETVERGRELTPVGVGRIIRGRRGGREDEPEPVVPFALGLGGQRDSVAVAEVVQRDVADASAVEKDFRRLALHAAVRRQVHDPDARLGRRPGERDLGLPLGPEEAVALRRRRLAVEAFDLVGLGGRGAEEQDVAGRPAVGHGDAPRQVVHDPLGRGRACERGRGCDHDEQTRQALQRRGRRGRGGQIRKGST